MKATDMNCVITHPAGSYAHKGLYPTLRFVTTLLILTLTATMAWAANSDATTLSTGIDDAPPLYEEATDWTTLKSLVEAGGTVTLTNDVTRNVDEVNVDEVIEVTKAVTLDLNGHTIYGFETGSSTHYDGYQIFYVTEGGNLTITDGSAGKGGMITNMWGAYAIYVRGTATFEAGTIASGGVYIYDYGKFTMTGGTINTEGDDSGVVVYENAIFTMTGGTITGNYIGVDIKSASSTFTVSGQVNITGNTDRDVSLVYDMDYDIGDFCFTPIHIDGPLALTARIGVWTNQDVSVINGKTFTKGLNGNGSKANFVSNKSDLVVVTEMSGELAFAAPIIAHQATFNGVTKYWATFYHNSENIIYRLPEGSQAFYMKSDNVLYLLGNGDIIPNDFAVIIMSDTDKIGLAKTDQGCDKPGDNKLIGTNDSKEVSELDLEDGKNVYVLSEGDGGLGFYKFTGKIPAHRAYYVE